jgi:hypothetical protein
MMPLGVALVIAGICWGQEGGTGNGLFRDVTRAPAATVPLVVEIGDFGTAPADGAANKALNEALDKPMEKFSRQDAPIRQAFEDFSKASGVPLEVNWKALETAGVDRQTTVTVATPDKSSARRVLNAIVEQLEGGATNLHVMVAGGQVIVSTTEDLESAKYLTTRVYNVAFLFGDVELSGDGAQRISELLGDTIKSSMAPATWADNGGAGSLRFLGGQMVVNQNPEVHEQVAKFVGALVAGAGKSMRLYDVRDLVKEGGDAVSAARMKQLKDVIETTCGRETWRDRGGKSSSISDFDGKLYVNASPIVHQQIETLLALMRTR